MKKVFLPSLGSTSEADEGVLLPQLRTATEPRMRQTEDTSQLPVNNDLGASGVGPTHESGGNENELAKIENLHSKEEKIKDSAPATKLLTVVSQQDVEPEMPGVGDIIPDPDDQLLPNIITSQAAASLPSGADLSSRPPNTNTATNRDGGIRLPRNRVAAQDVTRTPKKMWDANKASRARRFVKDGLNSITVEEWVMLEHSLMDYARTSNPDEPDQANLWRSAQTLLQWDPLEQDSMANHAIANPAMAAQTPPAVNPPVAPGDNWTTRVTQEWTEERGAPNRIEMAQDMPWFMDKVTHVVADRHYDWHNARPVTESKTISDLTKANQRGIKVPDARNLATLLNTHIPGCEWGKASEMAGCEFISRSTTHRSDMMGMYFKFWVNVIPMLRMETAGQGMVSVQTHAAGLVGQLVTIQADIAAGMYAGELKKFIRCICNGSIVIVAGDEMSLDDISIAYWVLSQREQIFAPAVAATVTPLLSIQVAELTGLAVIGRTNNIIPVYPAALPSAGDVARVAFELARLRGEADDCVRALTLAAEVFFHRPILLTTAAAGAVKTHCAMDANLAVFGTTLPTPYSMNWLAIKMQTLATVPRCRDDFDYLSTVSDQDLLQLVDMVGLTSGAIMSSMYNELNFSGRTIDLLTASAVGLVLPTMGTTETAIAVKPVNPIYRHNISLSRAQKAKIIGLKKVYRLDYIGETHAWLDHQSHRYVKTSTYRKNRPVNNLNSWNFQRAFPTGTPYVLHPLVTLTYVQGSAPKGWNLIGYVNSCDISNEIVGGMARETQLQPHRGVAYGANAFCSLSDTQKKEYTFRLYSFLGMFRMNMAPVGLFTPRFARVTINGLKEAQWDMAAPFFAPTQPQFVRLPGSALVDPMEAFSYCFELDCQVRFDYTAMGTDRSSYTANRGLLKTVPSTWGGLCVTRIGQDFAGPDVDFVYMDPYADLAALGDPLSDVKVSDNTPDTGDPGGDGVG